MICLKTKELSGWITGAHYDYSDREIWPPILQASFRANLYRLVVQLGLIDRECERFHGKVWPRLATTMIGEFRALNIIQSVENIEGIDGDIVDCGVWRGGSTILLKSASDESKKYRRVYCCDTFSGFDLHDAINEQQACPDALAVSLDEVKDNFRLHGVSTDRVQFLQGKVQNTLKQIGGPVALLRVDVDMAAPTLHCLRTIYPLMPPGGIVIVDDYGEKSFKCREAVDLFLSVNDHDDFKWIDQSGVCWRKP